MQYSTGAHEVDSVGLKIGKRFKQELVIKNFEFLGESLFEFSGLYCHTSGAPVEYCSR